MTTNQFYPNKLGRYILQEPIETGNSVVFKGFDPQLGRDVAVKIFRISNTDNLVKAPQDFVREAQTIAKFTHENIVTIYDSGVEDDTGFLVMEYIKGKSLVEFFSQGSQNWNIALKLFLPACEALAQAHQQGIIHRDIKPANMIVDSNEKIKILDFGLAFEENLSLRSDENSFIGTFAYASPEQFRSQPLSYQTDVYSFALVLLEAITGQNPQKIAYEKGDLHTVIYHPYDFRGFENLIPPQLQKILGIALNKEPHARYSNCQEFFGALEACYLNPPNEYANIIPIETPTGAVPISSSFYIERKADHVLINQILKPGTITTIRAGRQTGKTSLLLRGIRQAQKNQIPIVKIDFQQAQKEQLATLESLLYYIALEITLQTIQEVSALEKFWESSLPITTKFNRFFKGKILSQIPSSLTLAIDEADKLSEYPYRKDFFALLRSWNTEQAIDEDWEKLRLILVISTHPVLLIDNIHQSPFNVGLTIHLEDFDAIQVADLVRRHGNPLLESQVTVLMDLLGGHPYLIRQALYTMVMNDWNFNKFKQHALDSQGPFEQHLRFYRDALSHNDELNKAFRQIIKSRKCPDEKIMERLISVGLIKAIGNSCEPRCQLYADYFGKGR